MWIQTFRRYLLAFLFWEPCIFYVLSYSFRQRCGLWRDILAVDLYVFVHACMILEVYVCVCACGYSLRSLTWYTRCVYLYMYVRLLKRMYVYTHGYKCVTLLDMCIFVCMQDRLNACMCICTAINVNARYVCAAERMHAQTSMFMCGHLHTNTSLSMSWYFHVVITMLCVHAGTWHT
jgi:hypothetical protein